MHTYTHRDVPTHTQNHVSPWCRQKFNKCGMSRSSTPVVASGVAEGQWSAAPQSQRRGCCVATPRQHYQAVGSGHQRLRVLSLWMWQIWCDMSVHAQEHRPLSLIPLRFFLWHTNIHTSIQKQMWLSLFLSHRAKHRNTKTLKQRYAVTHSCMNTRTHARTCTRTHAGTHTHAHSTPRVAVKSSHSALHCKSNSLLLFSLALAFSFLPAQSSSPLCCLPVIPRHPTSPTPLLPPYS